MHREIVNKEIYTKPPLYLRVFERLIIEANNRCKRIPYGKGTKLIKRGERLTSIRQIAEWVAWYERGLLRVPNPKTISEILDWLCGKEMIEIYNKGNSQETHYNVVNYCIYQSKDDIESNAKVTVTGEVSKQSLDTNKKEKKDKKEKNIKDICADEPHTPTKKFTPPTLEEVKAYCQERKNNVDPEKWYDFYESKGWMIGKNKMKDWKAAVRTWERGGKERQQSQKSGNPFFELLKEEGKL